MPEKTKRPDLFSDEPLPAQYDEPQLPPPVKSVIDRLAEKLPGSQYYLTPSSDIRVLGTMGGSALGGAIGSMAPGPGTAIGSVLGALGGNRLTQRVQGMLPELLGEPPIDPDLTMLADTAGMFAGKGAGKVISSLANKGGLKQKLFQLMGTSPAEQFIPKVTNPEYTSRVSDSLQGLQKAGFPMSIGGITGSPFALEMEKLSPNAADFSQSQRSGIQQLAKEALSNWQLNKAGTKLKNKGGLSLSKTGEDIVEWANRRATSPVTIQDISSGLSHMNGLRRLATKIGPHESSIVLMKDALEKSFDPTSGNFLPERFIKTLHSKRDMFNEAAKYSSMATGKSTSDIKASWNRLAHAMLIQSRGQKVSERAIEMQMQNGVLGAVIGTSMLGGGSYPAVRGAAIFGKLTLLGPRLGKAMTDPEAVQSFINLTTQKAGSSSAGYNFRKLADWGIRNGVPFTTSKGTDVFFNGTTGKWTEVNEGEAVTPTPPSSGRPRLFN